MKVVNLASKKNTQDVDKINYLKIMKRELLVEIWLKVGLWQSQMRNKKRAIEWYPKGANMHESQENS